MLTGHWSKLLNAWRSAHGELTPTPHTGPNSWPMMVVTPDASDASMMRGDSRCTCVSMAPAVAIRPSPEMMVVPVPTTTSTSSIMSGLPARPTAQMRPSRMPIDTLPMRRVASMTTTLEITTSQVSLHRRGLQQQAVACGLGEAGEELVAALLRVVLDLDDQAGVAEPHAVADRRAVDGRVVVGQDLVGMQMVVRHLAVVVAVFELAVRVPVRMRCVRRSRSRPEVALLGRASKRGVLGAGRVERAVDQTGEADRHPCPADRHERRIGRHVRARSATPTRRGSPVASRRPRRGRTSGAG